MRVCAIIPYPVCSPKSVRVQRFSVATNAESPSEEEPRRRAEMEGRNPLHFLLQGTNIRFIMIVGLNTSYGMIAIIPTKKALGLRNPGLFSIVSGMWI